ncbi:MAG TPA: LysR family transcriptional regulator [Sedimentisphaerales bacterium]|nr:LysR family transcriptional regulator [Sedimentisphaerales bacterium]
MHLETLKVFCDLAELQSFSKTAEKHHLSQSAVSQQLAQLELMHKCELVNRKKRPIELTREGQLLHEAAKDILERYLQLSSQLNTLKSSTDSRINVGAIFSIGMHGLAKYVKKFMVKYPNVNVHIEYLSCAEIYDMALSGGIDIGLVAVPKKDKRVDVYDFENEPLVLVCSPSHPLAGKSRIDIHKIQFERFIAFEKDVPTRKWIDGILARYNITVYPVMEFDNIETIKRAVEINSGISILPRTTVVQELRSGTINAVEFSNENFVRPSGIVVRKDKVLSQAGRYLIELLRKNM